LRDRGGWRKQARGCYTFTGAITYRLPSLSLTRRGSASGAAAHDRVVAPHEVVGGGGILVAGSFAIA
jgi:hypothetical protein